LTLNDKKGREESVQNELISTYQTTIGVAVHVEATQNLKKKTPFRPIAMHIFESDDALVCCEIRII